MHRLSRCAHGVSLGRTDAREWVGGILRISGEDRDLIVWWSEGAVLGAARLARAPADAQVVLSLIDTLQAPLAGPPRRPRSLRVATIEIAVPLRARFGARMDVRVAPTPELDALAGEVERALSLLGRAR